MDFTIKLFLDWCSDLDGFESVNCDESEHYYYKDELVGGWAGDTRQYFIESIDTVDELKKAYKKEHFMGDFVTERL